ncbi:uncharacterized protein LOC135926035 isoform X2 [Gordionus sp. m RMFG-2023]|uniref:uncharacterized protein LOC135926035 isoform X2 n=1 Tax=Gordionus sp. m RMFG-2023 TaxID=3053472 RepID=UPI0031FC93FE
MVYSSQPNLFINPSNKSLNEFIKKLSNSPERDNLIHNIWKRLTSPRTNYTYSNSLSYSNESLNNIDSFDDDEYLIPIMSRQLLKGNIKQMSDRTRSKNLSKSIKSNLDTSLRDNSNVKEEYMTKSASYYSKKHANFPYGTQTSRTMPNLYGLDLSDDENYIDENINRYIPPPSHRNSNNINYYYNYARKITYSLYIFIIHLLSYIINAIKSLTRYEEHEPLLNESTVDTNTPSHSTRNRQISVASDEDTSEDVIDIISQKGGRKGVTRMRQGHTNAPASHISTSPRLRSQALPHSYDSSATRNLYSINNVGHNVYKIGMGLRDFAGHTLRSCYKYCMRNFVGEGGQGNGYQQMDSSDMRSRRITRQSNKHHPTLSAGEEVGDSDYYTDPIRRRHPAHQQSRHGLGQLETWRNLYARRRHRHDGLSLCSFPCPFLLFFFLIPLLLALLMRRLGYSQDYMMTNSSIKDYYNPLKNKFDEYNDKIFQNLPAIPGVKNLTRYPSLILNDTRSYVYDQAKWLKHNMNPFSSSDERVGYDLNDTSERGIFKRGLDFLIKDLDFVKNKLESLEKNYFSPSADSDEVKKYDPDWWKKKIRKSKSNGDEDEEEVDLKTIIEETVDKGLREIRKEMLDQNGVKSAFNRKAEGYYEGLTGVLDDLRNKFKAFSEKVETRDKSLMSELDTIRAGGDSQGLVGRVEKLSRDLERVTQQLDKARSNDVDLEKFAGKCGAADVNELLSEVNLSDMSKETKEGLANLLTEHFASHSKLDELKVSLQSNLERVNKDLLDLKSNMMKEIQVGSRSSTSSKSVSKSPEDEKKIRRIVEEMLDTYSADQLAMPDYALESAGGSVVSTRCSETFDTHSALIKLLGVPIWYRSNSPRVAIQPGTQPGQCWAFKGSSGYFVVQLAANVKPTSFSIDHIPKSLSPSGDIDSAVKDFSVWGLKNEKDENGVLLGRYRYEKSGRPLQLFLSQNPDAGYFNHVELKIESNWGNPNYTCLYRFRVHGNMKEY